MTRALRGRTRFDDPDNIGTTALSLKRDLNSGLSHHQDTFPVLPLVSRDWGLPRMIEVAA